MFRYQDAKNYYRFSLDQERTYRRLVKVNNGVVTLLAEDNVPYVSGQTYQVTVKAQGSSLEVGDRWYTDFYGDRYQPFDRVPRSI